MSLSFKSILEQAKIDSELKQKEQDKKNNLDNNIKNYSTDPSVTLKAQLNVNLPIKYNKIGSIKTPFNMDAQLYQLANGQKVVILPKKGPTFLKTYINTGSMNEPDNLRGISHFIEHNLFNGSDNLKPGEFFEKVSDMGAYANASTSFAKTDYYISSQLLDSDDLENEIKIHSDMLQNPKFDLDQIKKEQGPVISEISMVNDNVENIAINTCIKNLYQINTTSNDLIAGNIDNIKNISQKDLFDYYHQNYTPDNMITVITGEVNPDQTIKLISKYFNKQKNYKPQNNRIYEELSPIQKSIKEELTSKDTNNTIISLGFIGPKNTDTKSKIVTEVLLQILLGNKNSIINSSLDDFNESASCGLEKVGIRPDDNKAILINASVNPKNKDIVYDILVNKIKDISKNGVSEKQLDIAKRNLISDTNNIAESSDSINSIIGMSLLDSDFNYLANYRSIVNSITIDDIKNAANKFLDIEKASICIINPEESKIKKNTEISFSGKALEKDIYDESKIIKTTLDNNVQMVMNPTKSLKSNYKFTLKFSDIPNDINPSAIIILTMLFNRGNINLDNKSYSEFIDENNINMVFTSSLDSIDCYSNVDNQNLEKSVNLVKSNILQPRLTEEDFIWAKNTLKNNILADQNPRLLMPALFPDIKALQTKSDLLSSLNSLSLEDVKSAYNFILSNSKSKFVITCNEEKADETLDILKEKFSKDLPEFKKYDNSLEKTYAPIKEHKTLYNITNKKQAEVVKAYKFQYNDTIDEIVELNLMNLILGGSSTSRLFSDLRETQKLAYRVKSQIDSIGNSGYLLISINTTTDDDFDKENDYHNITKSLDGFNKHINLISTEKVSEEELKKAKMTLKNKILNANETSLSQTDDLSNALDSIYGISRTDLILKAIDKVTVNDIQKCANRVFKNPSIDFISASENTLNSLKNDK